MAVKTFRFPKRFYFGASTSAHQVEGNTHNQWTVWELENANSLAKAASYKLDHLASWPLIKDQASDPRNYVSGRATDHYNLYEQDFDAVKAMGLNAFRFSIEWSRIEPSEGSWDAAEIQHYREYIAALKKRGIEPFVTLFHWTLPVWFADKGGFEKSANIKYFVRFADKILQELGADLRYITTINEPDTYMFEGYIAGVRPPQKRSPVRGVWVYINLLRAHKRIYRQAHRHSRRHKIGWTKSYDCVTPLKDLWWQRLATRMDYLFRDDLPHFFVGRKIDFVGVNYYWSEERDGFKLLPHTDARQNDLGWDMVPDDLEHVLIRLSKKHPKLPMFITESGVADLEDKHRQWWIAHSLQAIHQAMEAGARIEGYLHWSLLDNFEWGYGKWPRFGLLEVDYKTMKRTPRKSALWYSKVVKQMRK